MEQEPASTIGKITAAVSAVMGAAVTFGASFTEGQINKTTFAVGAVLTAVAAVGSWIQGRSTRARVVPEAKYDAVVAQLPTGAIVPPKA